MRSLPQATWRTPDPGWPPGRPPGWPEEDRPRASAGPPPGREPAGPRLVELQPPADGTPGPGDPLLLRFDEPVVIGRGTIRLTSEAGTLRIPVKDAGQVTVAGDLLRVEPARALDPGTTYTIELGRRSVLDLDGNRFAGAQPGLRPVLATPAEAPAAPASWTLLVYMAADNDLEPYALRDLAEMERVRLPGSVDLVALVDRSPWYVAGPDDFADTRRGPVRPDGEPSRVGAELASIGERDTGDPATLTEFLDWAAATFPAERYGLVLWNHGDGLDGVAWDQSSRGDRLTLAETREAIARSTLGRVDLLGFDACSMALVEVASELRAVAGVMVASQELEPADGWAYDRLLDGLARRPDAAPDELAAILVETYAARYAGQRDITLSALDLAALPSLEAALDDLADAVVAGAGRGELRAIAAAAAAARPYPRDRSEPYRDLGGFLEGVLAEVGDPRIGATAREALAALEAVVIAEAGTVGPASGLSIHLPVDGPPPWPGYAPGALAFLDRTDWHDLIDRLVAQA